METKVDAILKNKDLKEIVQVQPETTVIEALEIMEQYGVGAVLVMDGERLAGIFTERDYARKGIIKGRKAKSTPMTEVMTANVFTVQPDEGIRDCMGKMNSNGIRHLPVIDNEGIVKGVLSIRDIVTALIKEQRQHINFLENYISGSIAG
ncbi:CBS domain-containing protein [Jiulongibacter sediminis]|uniref:Histidine kinase n=1 Tax=Jiulongibacter sediminis TaxID=1605367 RepID=A0A0P7BE71_9BACT|nr:CBS domain-containing protein [Jiulongibacter sediminis]KPM49070.1 histidine kinase [Jiulongibacter sediminis]TBX25585.1 histidine kinase [Jiulongibacter sediminis]